MEKFKSFFISLTDEDRENIFETLRVCFSDFPNFDTIVADKLQQLLIDVESTEIDENCTKRITDKYFDTKSFKDTPERKLLFTEIQLIFKCCFVLILKKHLTLQHLKWFTIDELLNVYQHHRSFNNLTDREELQYLLEFRNTLRVALEIIPPAAHKQLLINIAGRLEGSNCVEYITGGGQKPCVQRRVAIYEHEGKVQRGTKTPKKQVTENSGKKYASHEYVSVRKIQNAAKMLTDEEIELLKRPRISIDDNYSASLPSFDFKNYPPNDGQQSVSSSYPTYSAEAIPDDYIHTDVSSVSADNLFATNSAAAFDAVKNSKLNLLGIRFKPQPVTRYTTFGPVNLQEVNTQKFDPAFFDMAEQEQQVQDQAAAYTLLNIARESSTGSATDELLKNLDTDYSL
eukprot:gene33319-43076_t